MAACTPSTRCRPSSSSRPLAQQSRILAADGSIIATFYDENRIVVPLGKVSKVMQTAIVAIEDDRFYEHGGVDLRGLGRALVNNAQGGGTQGASTITQQFVKNTLVENAKADGDVQALKDAITRTGASGYARKLQELKYAVSLEKTMTKEDILQGYLNIAYFGAGTYGVEAAALHYFGVHAASLNLAQSAMIAGLVQSPSHYDPYLNMAAAVARRNTVINRMLQLNLITQKQHDAAVKSKIVLHKGVYGNDCSVSKYPYFCNYVRQHPEQDRRHRRGGPAARWPDRPDHPAAEGPGRGPEGDQQVRRHRQQVPGRLGRVDRRAGHRQDHRDGAVLTVQAARAHGEEQEAEADLGHHPGQLEHRQGVRRVAAASRPGRRSRPTRWPRPCRRA